MMTNHCPQSLPVPTIGIGAVVFHEAKVLLIKRGQPPAQGLWSVPGGKQEPGESMVGACRREVAEETGLAVVVRQLVAVVERRQEGFHYVIMDFLAELENLVDPVPTPGSDVSEAKWLALQDLQGYPLVAGLLEIIARSYAMLTGGYRAGLYADNPQDGDFILPAQIHHP